MLKDKKELIPIMRNMMYAHSAQVQFDEHTMKCKSPIGELYVFSKGKLGKILSTLVTEKYNIDNLYRKLKSYKVEINLPIQHVVDYNNQILIITPAAIIRTEDIAHDIVYIKNLILRFLSSTTIITAGIHRTDSAMHVSCVKIFTDYDLITDPDEIKQLTVEALL